MHLHLHQPFVAEFISQLCCNSLCCDVTFLLSKFVSESPAWKGSSGTFFKCSLKSKVIIGPNVGKLIRESYLANEVTIRLTK